jgi:ArsR family transcriptional regulator
MKKEKINIDTCSTNIIHEDIIDKVAMNMPNFVSLETLSEFFKLFSDSTRIKIISALIEEEMCVCDISALLKVNRSAISHQLKTLKLSNIVKFRREGKVVYYSIMNEEIKALINTGLKSQNIINNVDNE